MKFKNLKINQRFKFKDDLKIYRKTEMYIATRELKECVVYYDAEVELVSEDEKEDYEAIEKGSYWNYLVHEEGVKGE